MLNEKLSSIMLILWFNFILGLNLLSFVLNSVSYDILEKVDINWDVSPVSSQVTVFLRHRGEFN